jgi:phenylpropionate dioxygenase-like ring-hydroxylating dioxygenase large terminal subunit
MRAAVRADVMRRLRRTLEDPTTAVPRGSTALAVSRYLDDDELEKERRSLFAKLPIVVAHASELPDAGSYVTLELGGVPLLVVRDDEGEVRAFVNACRHRGARLTTEERGACHKLLSCPYHGWSYRLDGSLFKVPREEVFGALDRDALRLREIPTAIRHGLVWASLEGPLDVASFLGPVLEDDFASFELAEHRTLRSSIRVKRANWKLVMDAFAEGYHLKTLHAQSLARFFLEAAIVDDCTPHVRQVGARKSMLDEGASWDLRKDTTVFYDVFPNTVLVFHPHWISALTLFPEAVDRVRVVHRMLVPPGETDEAKLTQSFTHIDEHVFDREDLSIAESIQSTLASGANREVLLGGPEEGMRLFHAARDAALARAE